MFVAHLPAGYLLTRAMQARAGDRSRHAMAVGLVASVVPDLDLLWFYLVSDRRVPHHDYATHTPLPWIVLAALAWPLARRLGGRGGAVLVAVAAAGVLLHLALDTVAGGIRWLWPLWDGTLVLARVEATHGWWVWNFVLHWTFLAELALVAAALLHRRATRGPA